MKEDYHFRKLAIYGVGLLGGSLALAAKHRGLVESVVGIGRSQESLIQAKDVGAIDSYTRDLAEGVADADLVVMCTPVRRIVEMLPLVMANVKAGAIVTDVGSTKTSIVEAALQCRHQSKGIFIGSHPMAGSERSGVAHARPDLFEGATCFLTPAAQTPHRELAKLGRWWRAVGCRLAIARPERHDALVAMVSHLPHLVAVALVRAVESFNEDQNLVKGIIGNGFRDTTRIACGSAQMWQDICAENSREIERACNAFQAVFNQLLAAHSSNPEELESHFLSACEFRKGLEDR